MWDQIGNNMYNLFSQNPSLMGQHGNMLMNPIQRKGLDNKAMQQGAQRMLATPIQGVAQPKPAQSFNPYALGASMLGNIGGGHRAKLGTEDVWEAGGVLQGTDVGNTMNALGDVAGNFGPMGAVAGLGLKGAADIANLIGYDPKVSDIDVSSQLMQQGGPTLQIGSEIGSASNVAKEGKKMAGKGALAGAKTGAAIGTMIAPGVGTAIGGLVGTVGGWLTGKSAKKKAERAYAEAMGEIDETTGEFNAANISASQNEFGQERRLAMLGRERNPFLVNTSNPFMV